MSTITDNTAVAEIKAAAQGWYEQQIARIAQCLGPSWPTHREWIEHYVAEEVRQKLIARGWRVKP